jgi:Tat protein translocase TatB subunit
MNIGPTELVIILVIALIVLGPRKLPDLGKSLGQAMAQFRRASDDFKRSWEQEVETEKARLAGIKANLETDFSYGAGDDFNYSVDPSRGESESTSSGESTTEGCHRNDSTRVDDPRARGDGSRRSRAGHRDDCARKRYRSK